jgi:hypothetical protein
MIGIVRKLMEECRDLDYERDTRNIKQGICMLAASKKDGTTLSYMTKKI